MKQKIVRLSLVIISGILVIAMFQIYSFNNRHADNLSSYCNIDFIGLKQDGVVKAAFLEIVDFRYSGAKLSPQLELIIDNREVSCLAQSISQSNNDQGSLLEQRKAKNILKVVLDEAVVKQIKSATMVKVGFKYEDDTNFRVFPLSQVDLNYWKNQL